MKIGFFGGSFDPLHFGHVIPLLQTREFLGLDRIVLIPSYQKIFQINGIPGATSSNRLEMLNLFCRHYSFMAIEDYEIQAQQKIYTIETIRYILARYPEDEPVLIMGRDNFDRFNEWKDYRNIVDLIPIAVMNRQSSYGHSQVGWDVPGLARFTMIPNSQIEISSTMVREWCQAGQPIEWLVPHPVLAYIHQHHLYGVRSNGPVFYH